MACEQNDANFNQKIISPSEDPNNQGIFFARGIGEIKISEVTENGLKGIEISRVEYQPPSIEGDSNPALAEIGQTLNNVLYRFHGVAGTEDLVSTVVNPDPGPLTPNDGFQEFTVASITSLVPGVASPYVVKVTDAINTIVNKTLGPLFQHRFYQLYSDKDLLSASDVNPLTDGSLGTSLQQLFPGDYEYFIPVVPGGTKHIYWLSPQGASLPTGAIEGPLLVPMDFSHPDIVITNQYGANVTYKVIRTAEKFGGNAVTPAKIKFV